MLAPPYEASISYRTFVRTTQKKIQKKFKIIPKRFEGGVAFEVFVPIGSCVNEKFTHKKKKNQKM